MIQKKTNFLDKLGYQRKTTLDRLGNLYCDIFSDQTLPTVLSISIILVSHLQIFSLFVDQSNDFTAVQKNPTDPLPPTDFLINLSIFLKYSTMYRLYSNTLTLFLIIFVAFGIFTASFSYVFFSLLFDRDPKDSMNSKKKKLKFLRIFGLFYDPIFFLCSHSTFVVAAFSLQNRSVLKIFAGNTLSEQQLIALMVFGILFLIFNVINGIFMTLYGYNPIDNNNTILLSRSNNSGDRILFLVKLIYPILMLGGELNSSFFTIIRTGLMFFIIAYVFYHEFKEIPFYNKMIGLLSIQLKCVLLIASFSIWLIALMLETKMEANQAGFVLTVFTSPLLMKFVVSKMESNVFRALISDPKSIKSPSEVLQQALGFRTFVLSLYNTKTHVIKSTSDYDFQYQGLISRHMIECTEPSCVCKKEKNIFDPITQKYVQFSENPTRDKIFLLYFGRMLFQVGSKNFNDNLKLKIHQAYYEAVNMRFAHQAYIILQAIGRSDLTFEELILVSFTKRKILQIIANKYDERIPGSNPEETKSTGLIDSKFILEVENKMNIFKQKIINSLDLTIALWAHLKLNTLELIKISKIHEQIEDIAIEIEEHWKSFQGYSHVLEEFYNLIYGLYLMNIRNDMLDGPKKIKRAYFNSLAKRSRTKLKKEISSKTIFDANCVTILLSGDKQTLGTIFKISSTSEAVFGHKIEDLVNHNILKLLPSIYHNSHQEYLHAYLETGEEVIFNKHRDTFARHALGYNFPINLYVKMNPDLEQGITYIGVVKPIVNFDYYIISDINGNIDSMSENLTKELRVNPEFFSKEKIKIGAICPQLEDVVSAFNYKAKEIYGNTIFQSFITNQKRKASRYDEEILKDLNETAKRSESSRDSERNKNMNSYFYDVYSKDPGAKVTMILPKFIKEHPINAKWNKAYERQPSEQNAEKIEEFNFICQIKDIVHKGKQLVRVYHLKAALQNDEEDLRELAGEISQAEKFVRKHRRETKKTIHYGTLTFGKLAGITSNKIASLESPTKKSSFAVKVQPRDSSDAFPKYKADMINESEHEKSRNSSLESNHITTEYDGDGDDIFDPNMIDVHHPTSYLTVLKETEDITKTEEGLIKLEAIEVNQSFMNTSAAPLNLDLVNNPPPEVQSARRKKIVDRFRSLKFFMNRSSHHRSSLEKKSEAISKSREQDLAIYANMDLRDDDRSSTMSRASTSQGFNRLYVKSFGEKYYSLPFEIISKTMMLVLILNIVLSIIVYFVNISSMKDTETYIKVKRTASNLNFYSSAMFRRYKAMDLLLKGIFTNDRFYSIFGFPDYFATTQNTLRSYATIFDQNNQDFYQQLFSFDNDFADSIYALQIPLKIYDLKNKSISISTVDFFQKVNFLLSILNECNKYNYQQLSKNVNNIQEKVYDMILNTGDDLLLACDQIQHIVNDKISSMYQYILNSSLLLCAIIIGLMTIVFLSFFILFYNLAGEKENCLGVLAMIDSQDIDFKYDFFLKLKSLMIESGIDSDILMRGFQDQMIQLNMVLRSTGKRSLKKHTSNKGLYTGVVLDVFKILLIFVISIFYFTYTLLDFSTYIQNNRIIADQIDITQETMQNQTYLLEAVRLIFVDNGTGTTLNESPLKVYKKYYDGLKDITGITNAYLGNDKPSDPYLKELLYKDLCFNVTAAFCKKLAKGTLSAGILEFESYFLNTMRNLYNQWISIRYTNYDLRKYSQQQDFIELEYTLPILARNMYVRILDHLQNEFASKNASKKSKSDAGLGIFICAMIIMVFGIWIPLMKYLNKEQRLNKSVFRLIPPDIVLRNNYIKIRFKKYSKSLSAYKF